MKVTWEQLYKARGTVGGHLRTHWIAWVFMLFPVAATIVLMAVFWGSHPFLSGSLALALVMVTFAIFILPRKMLPSLARREADDGLDLSIGTLENAIRGVLIQVVGGILLIMTVFVAYMEMVESQERVEIAQQQLDQQATLTLKEQYAQRFNNGAGGLKETSTEAKIAAIAQLEQVAADAMNESIPDDERATATRYREPAVRVISAYARSASRVPVSEIPSYGNDPEQTPLLGFRLPEVQFAVEALSRINQDGQVPLDLTQVDLIRAQLPDAHLARAVLTGARMQGADLTKADLTKAVLRGADLRGAGLDGAIVTDVNCSGALIDDRTSGPAECLGSATKITGSITSPKYGTTVPHVVTLQGETVADVEAFGFQLWVAVVPHPAATPSDDDRYYPHRQAVLAGEPSDSGPPQWSLEGVTLGQPDEVGMRFDLALVLADGKATKVIEGYLSQPNPPGMKFLPVGAVVLDKVAVTRG